MSDRSTAASRPAGQLRVYLGAAPGVGKTFAMLNEGRRRQERGTDVVVGIVETHGRARTAEQIGDLEVVPAQGGRAPRQRRSTEMDVDAVLRRRPELVLVDELAHTNAPGSRHEKRWQDVEELLAAGIDVISTVNIQHLESLNDVVERITGIRQRETIPDHAVRARRPDRARRHGARGAAPAPRPRQHLRRREDRRRPRQLLPARQPRRRCASWRCCGSPTGSTTALQDYRERHGITRPWETRERVVVALAGAPGHRSPHPPRRPHGAAGQGRPDRRPRRRRLRPDVRRRRRGGDDGRAAPAARGARRRVPRGRRATTSPPPSSTLARSENATQIVLGASGRSRWQELFGGSVINRVVRAVRSDRRARHLPPRRAGDAPAASAGCRACARCSPRCRHAASCGAGCSPSSACR